MQWTNYKTVGEIKKRIKEEESRGDLRGMTRAETQFIRTHKKDLAKYVNCPSAPLQHQSLMHLL